MPRVCVLQVKPNRTLGQWSELLRPINNSYALPNGRSRNQFKWSRVDLLLVHPGQQLYDRVAAPKEAHSLEAEDAGYVKPGGEGLTYV